MSPAACIFKRFSTEYTLLWGQPGQRMGGLAGTLAGAMGRCPDIPDSGAVSPDAAFSDAAPDTACPAAPESDWLPHSGTRCLIIFALYSPWTVKISLPTAFRMPQDFTCSSITGSSSSNMYSFSTFEANSSISFLGRGCTRPSFSTLASGMASRTY